MVEGDQEPGGDGVGVGDPVGVQGVLGERYEGVPDAGAVVAGVPAVSLRFAGVLVDVAARGAVGGLGSGEGEEGCLEEGAVLGGPAAADPDPTGPVGDDRQGAVRGGRRVPRVPGRLRACGRRRRGRRPRPGAGPPWPARWRSGWGVAEHQLLPPAAGPLPGRQIRHRRHDHVGLLRVTRPVDQRLPGPRQRTRSAPWRGLPAACPRRDAGRPGGSASRRSTRSAASAVARSRASASATAPASTAASAAVTCWTCPTMSTSSSSERADHRTSASAAHRRRSAGQDVCGGGAGGELRDRHRT